MKKVRTILLVDDDETTNLINELLISEMGITDELLQAQNGEEALMLLQERIGIQQQPDLIFLDISMPVMDGFEFLEAFEQLSFPGKPPVVIILTTSLNPKDVARIEKSDVADYVNKPLTEKMLAHLFEKHIS